MEDRFKFRGLTKININSAPEWCYGYLYQEAIDNEDKIGFDYKWFIKEQYGDHFRDFEVDIETVGQCTGLKDKAGNLIYENDIIGYKLSNEEWMKYKVYFCQEECGFKAKQLDEDYGVDCTLKDGWVWSKEICGNIHQQLTIKF